MNIHSNETEKLWLHFWKCPKINFSINWIGLQVCPKVTKYHAEEVQIKDIKVANHQVIKIFFWADSPEKPTAHNREILNERIEKEYQMGEERKKSGEKERTRELLINKYFSS